MNRRLKIVLAILSVLGLLTVWLWRPAKLLRDLGELERVAGGTVWVNFDEPGWMPDSWGVPLTTFVESKVQSTSGRKFVSAAIMALGGGIHSMIFDGNNFPRHVPEIRKRFPELREARFWTTDLTEAEVMQFSRELRDYPSLEALLLRDGKSITDATLAPLAGHPRLETLEVHHSGITSQSAGTFAAMPALRTLMFVGARKAGRETDLEKLTPLLPVVRVWLH
jgi:hypothetical protein